MPTASVRCPRCKSEVQVPENFGHGVMLGCKTCHSQLRLLRNDKGVLRLVVGDPAPLREQVAFNRSHVEKLQADLRTAQHSLGIGTNGFGIGVLWLVFRVGVQERLWDMALVLEAVGIAIVTGVLLETANYFFLAKRKTMTQLSNEIAQMKEEQVFLQSLIRDAERAQQQIAANSSTITTRTISR